MSPAKREDLLLQLRGALVGGGASMVADDGSYWGLGSRDLDWSLARISHHESQVAALCRDLVQSFDLSGSHEGLDG